MIKKFATLFTQNWLRHCLLALLTVPVVAVANDDAVAETGKWRHSRSATALETADYLLLDAEVGDRIWTLARRCNLDQAWIQSSVSGIGEALDYSLSYVEYRNDEWVRVYKTRIRQDENPIKEWTGYMPTTPILVSRR